MLSTMTNVPSFAQKSLRIQGPSSSKTSPPGAFMNESMPAPTMPKSILKSRQVDPTSIATVPNPLQSETYFQGPLRTLVASIQNENSSMLSLHDITEAYVVLACRIEAQANNLGDETAPAVAAVRVLPSHVICAAIRRDVARAIPGPQVPDASLDTQGRLTDEEKNDAKDRSSLCHAALRFVTGLFKFPSLYRLLKLHEQAWVMKELLDVGLSYDLATINPQKTYSLVIGVLGNQRLPDSILRPFRPKIATLVERAGSGKMEGSATSGPHIDGLKAVYALLHRHSTLLLPEFLTVLKVVLQNLVGPIAAFRDLAAKALTAFSHAVLRSDVSMPDLLKLSCIVGAFIDKEVQRAKDARKHDVDTFVLQDFLKLSENDPRIIQRVTQLLNIVATFLVLSGPCVFVRPASLKFLVKAIGKTQSFRQRELNMLRAATWSCLVRAYGLLPRWEIQKGPGLEENAFRVVRQEYREDVGISVIATLLGSAPESEKSLGCVCEAITYLSNLGQMPETRCVSIGLLRRLLGGILNDEDSDICSWIDPSSVIPEWLSNGSTLEMEPRQLKKTLLSFPGADIHVVRILEPDELIFVWNSLLEAFQSCAIGQLFDKKTSNRLENDTIRLWQALLRIHSTLTPDFSRTIVRKSVLEHLATMLCEFLDAHRARYPIKPIQALSATHQLWKVVNEELGEVWSAALASSIYRRLLKALEHDISGNSLGDEWIQLSRALVTSSPKRTLEILAELQNADAQRTVWLDMVRYIRFQEHPCKQVLMHLLLYPIQASRPLLSDEMQFSYWDMLFMLAIMHEEPEVVCVNVSEELQRALSTKSCCELRKFFFTTVSHASRADVPASLALLSVVSDYLEEAYPPEDSENNELVELVPLLQTIITGNPSLSVLRTVSHGLIPWFEDRKSFINDDAYNDGILPLYCDLFNVIRRISPIEEAFIELAELITAPFSRERIPPPAIGPIAFKEFWDSVGPSLSFRAEAFPPALTDCIISLGSTFGGYVPQWMESQLENEEMQSVVDEVVPASVDDVESSDFSPVAAKKFSGDTTSSPTRKAEGAIEVPTIRAPEVSPSIGETSQQFARYRRNEANPQTLSVDIERVCKKRKLVPLVAFETNGGQRMPLDTTHYSEPQHKQAGKEKEQYDYSSWEVQVASQDVRDVLQDDGSNDGDKTPRPRRLDLPEETCDSGLKESKRTRDKLPAPPRARIDHPIDRSQTAPASLPSALEGHKASEETSSIDQSVGAAKLRRTHTTTEVPLDALEKLHARLSADADDMQTQDLAHATRLTFDVLGLLNGRMSRKLERRQ